MSGGEKTDKGGKRRGFAEQTIGYDERSAKPNPKNTLQGLGREEAPSPDDTLRASPPPASVLTRAAKPSKSTVRVPSKGGREVIRVRPEALRAPETRLPKGKKRKKALAETLPEGATPAEIAAELEAQAEPKRKSDPVPSREAPTQPPTALSGPPLGATPVSGASPDALFDELMADVDMSVDTAAIAAPIDIEAGTQDGDRPSAPEIEIAAAIESAIDRSAARDASAEAEPAATTSSRAVDAPSSKTPASFGSGPVTFGKPERAEDAAPKFEKLEPKTPLKAAPASDEHESERGGRGLMLGVGMIVVAAVAAGGVWLAIDALSPVPTGGADSSEPAPVDPRAPVEPPTETEPAEAEPAVETTETETEPETETTAVDVDGEGSVEPEATETAATETVAEPVAAEPTAADIDLGPVPPTIAAMSRMERRQIAQDLRIRARALHREGQYARAENLWKLALQHDPDNAVAAEGLARTLNGLTRRTQALAWARHAVELAPDSPRNRETLGDMLRARGDVAEAIQQYRAGLAATPGDARLRRRLAVALRQRRR